MRAGVGECARLLLPALLCDAVLTPAQTCSGECLPQDGARHARAARARAARADGLLQALLERQRRRRRHLSPWPIRPSPSPRASLPLRCCSRGWAARAAARPLGGCNHNCVGVCVRVGSGRSRTPWVWWVDKKTIVNADTRTPTRTATASLATARSPHPRALRSPTVPPLTP